MSKYTCNVCMQLIFLPTHVNRTFNFLVCIPLSGIADGLIVLNQFRSFLNYLRASACKYEFVITKWDNFGEILLISCETTILLSSLRFHTKFYI
jgi:hypothetical protein